MNQDACAVSSELAVVCDPRRKALLKDGNKNDRIDARKLAELLYLNKLNPVYHGEHGGRALKELVRSYLTVTKDLARHDPGESHLSQLGHSLYRQAVYARCHRAEWLGKISEPGVRRRAKYIPQKPASG